MKKLLTVFLLIFYTATTFGVTLKFHYCGDHLNNVSLLNISDKGVCSCGSIKMPKGCCQDKVIYEKTDNHKTDQQNSTLNNLAFSSILPVTIGQQDYHLISGDEDLKHLNYHARHSKPIAIYLSIRSLII
jgi:hypothetical protein